jgi:methyl-accepting chemotaxis protein
MSDFRTQGILKYLEDKGESFANCLEKKQIGVGESTWLASNGIHTAIRTNIPRLNEKGDIKYVYVSYVEITKIVKTQKFMEHEVAELAKNYALIAAGDLTIRYEITKPDDDTRDTYNQIVKLRDAMRGVIKNLQVNIKEVNNQMTALTISAANATSSLKEADKGVQQIAKNAGNVSANAEKAASNVEQIAKAVQDLSAAVEEITASMESVTVLSRETNDLSQKGADLAGKAEKSMKEISTSSANVFEIVAEVEKQMVEISKIIVLIRDIANQTNLLALNAAIEAARAGDAGRGFAVVATEVKSLAQESRNSAEKIEEMISTLKKSTQNAAVAMGEEKKIVEQGEMMVTETLGAFNKIATAIDKVAKSVSEVAAATEEQAATTEEITASIDEVAKLVDNTAKDAGDAAAATQESSAALDEITRMVESVNKIAGEAMEANKRFKVE